MDFLSVKTTSAAGGFYPAGYAGEKVPSPLGGEG
jgi:hypothetical protein